MFYLYHVHTCYFQDTLLGELNNIKKGIKKGKKEIDNVKKISQLFNHVLEISFVKLKSRLQYPWTGS